MSYRLSAFIALLLLSALSLAAEPTRPNILFFAVDDLRPDIGCFGNTEVKTPNIDALAKRGTVFRRAYCQQAVCSPSRTSLLTGMRPDSTKVYDLVTHFRTTIPDAITLPQHFKNAGYHTVGMGKIFHGGLDDAVSWSEPHRNGAGQGYVLPENKERVAAGNAKAKADGTKKKKKNASAPGARGEPFEMADVPDNAYTDGSLAEMAIAELRERKEAKQPFFLAVGFVKPHLPFNAPKKYWDLYDPKQLKLAANPFRPKDAPPYAVTDFGELRNYFGVPASGPVSEEYARHLIHAYRAASSFTDANIGKVLDELDKLGLRENTIVVLWGDHGWKLGEHASWCKHSNMENDTNAPLVIAAPGHPASGKRELPDGSTASGVQPHREADASRSPRVCNALVEFVDIYPTLCDLAGLPLPAQLQGVSARPLLDDPAKPWKTAAFSQYPRSFEGQQLMGYALRTDRYRYVEWRNRQTGEPVARELYDHQTDPAENQSLAGRPEHKQLIEQLATQLKAGWQAAKPK